VTTAGVLVRDARDDDAEAGAALLRESIRRLCAADHLNDPAAISDWITNKSPAEFRRWKETPDLCLLVAERDGRLAGVGLVREDGELLLLYIAPECAYSGVGKTLLHALEVRAQMRGAHKITLETTTTGREFYETAGYAPARPGSLRLEKALS